MEPMSENLEGQQVKCPGCKRISHETTEHYQPDVLVDGSFVRLINPYKSRGWTCFDDGGLGISTTTASMMLCPSCAMPLAPKGRLLIVKKESPCKAVEIVEKALENMPAQTSPTPEKSIIVKRTPLKMDSGIDYTCQVCGKVCGNGCGLASHMAAHKRKGEM